MYNQSSKEYLEWRNQHIRDFVAGKPEELVPSEPKIWSEFIAIAEKKYEDDATKEEEECKKAWAAAPNAKHAWNFHHGILIEPLEGISSTRTTPQIIESRIHDIKHSKGSDQRVARFRNFRPVKLDTVTEKSNIEDILKAHKEQVPHPEDWTPSDWDAKRGILKGTEGY